MSSPVASQPRLLVSGSREVAGLIHQQALDTAHKALTVVRRMLEVPAGTQVILDHGGARGADTVFANAAAGPGRARWHPRAHPAQWDTHCFDPAQIPAHSVVGACPPSHRNATRCRMAGHRRNAEMIALGPKLLLAWPMHSKQEVSAARGGSNSRGTWAQIEIARKAGVPAVVLWTGTPDRPTEPRLTWPGTAVTTDRATGAYMDRQKWLAPLVQTTGANNRWVPLEQAWRLTLR